MKMSCAVIAVLALVFAVGCSRAHDSTSSDTDRPTSAEGTWTSGTTEVSFYGNGTVRWGNDRDGVWSQEGAIVRVNFPGRTNDTRYILNFKGAVLEGAWFLEKTAWSDQNNSGVVTLVRKRTR